jgi:hypothetical protein
MWLQPPITAGDMELIGIAIPFIKTKMTKGPSVPTVLPKFSCSLVKWSIQFLGNAWQNDISTKRHRFLLKLILNRISPWHFSKVLSCVLHDDGQGVDWDWWNPQVWGIHGISAWLQIVLVPSLPSPSLDREAWHIAPAPRYLEVIPSNLHNDGNSIVISNTQRIIKDMFIYTYIDIDRRKFRS